MEVKGRVTKCSGGSTYDADISYFCEWCGRRDAIEYEFEIQIDLLTISPKSYAYCCTYCHDINCPFHKQI